MTTLPSVLILFVFFRNLFVACCNPFHAATRTTGPALVIVYMVFPISAATIFNTFMTESFDDGNQRLTYDLSFDVTDPRYDFTFKYALIMVFVYPVGIPLLFATILFANRRALRDESRGEDNELIRNSNPALDRFAVLFDVYRPEKWWWEVYESLRRVLTTGVLVLIDPGSILQLSVGLALCLQGVVMYSYHRPYEEALENTLAICMQLETFLTVYVALLGKFVGGSFASKDERMLGIILTVTTTFCVLFGMGIVSVAMCKLNPREPWVVTMKRVVRSSASAPASDPNATSDANDASAPDVVGFELMDKQKPKQVVDLEKGRGSAAESPSEVVKRLNAENAFLRQENVRLEADKKKVQEQANEVQLRLETDVERLQSENEALRASSTSNQQGGGGGELGGEAVTQDTAVEEALVEAPASAEDIERQATTEHESKSAAVEASASQPEANEDALNTMLAMGLPRQHCVIALRRCEGDANAATEFCLRPTAKK